jgi:hypothetical protein
VDCFNVKENKGGKGSGMPIGYMNKKEWRNNRE